MSVYSYKIPSSGKVLWRFELIKNGKRYTKRGFKNNFQTKIQSISFREINNLVKKYNLDPTQIKEEELFIKKIFKRSKGSLKLLSTGEPENVTNIEISYASKKAIDVFEKSGGKIKLTKK